MHLSIHNLFRDVICKKRASVLLNILLLPLTLASYIFLGLIEARRFSYRIGLLKSNRLNCKVISIGNLTVGGTGKTPFVIFLAERLKQMGRSVAVITRGYKAGSKEPISLVSDKERVLLAPSDAGDEAYLVASRLKGVPVIIGKDRHLAGEYALRSFQVDTIILDDGFQYLSLEKDVEILLVDSTDPAGNGYMLPRGILREPFSGLSRSNAIILTRADQADRLDSVVGDIKRYSDSIGIYYSRFKPVGLKEIRSGAEEGIGHITGKRLLLFSGIGNPRSFSQMIGRLGGEVVREMIFPDHHNYMIRELEQIELFASRNKIDIIVTTEKDGVKIAETPFGYLPIWALRVDLILEDQDKLEELILGEKRQIDTY
ncbi:MAG TPA: tetraacyldisaccharide 4'-kinase [Nitrospiria bacterium]|nr:tetraacyldisaccharide 4'-kinase [Nitrospiria bacterium]